MKKHRSIKVIIFDLDGTLIDSKLDITHSINLTLKDLHLPPLACQKVVSFIGKGVFHLLHSSFPHLSYELINSQVLPLFKKYYLKHLTTWTKPYSNVTNFLSNTSYQTALLTHKPKLFTEKIIDHFNWSPYFSTILCGDELNHPKPHPYGIHRILSKLNLSNEEAVMVGDSFVDIQAGQRAQTKTIAATYGYGNLKDLLESSPDKRYNSFNEIQAYLEAL